MLTTPCNVKNIFDAVKSHGCQNVLVQPSKKRYIERERDFSPRFDGTRKNTFFFCKSNRKIRDDLVIGKLRLEEVLSLGVTLLPGIVFWKWIRPSARVTTVKDDAIRLKCSTGMVWNKIFIHSWNFSVLAKKVTLILREKNQSCVDCGNLSLVRISGWNFPMQSDLFGNLYPKKSQIIRVNLKKNSISFDALVKVSVWN